MVAQDAAAGVDFGVARGGEGECLAVGEAVLVDKELVEVFFELGKRGSILVALQQHFGGVGVKFPAFAQGGECAAGVGLRGDAQVYPLVRMGEGKRGKEKQEKRGFHGRSGGGR